MKHLVEAEGVFFHQEKILNFDDKLNWKRTIIVEDK